MAFRNRLISASSMTSAWPIQLRLDTRESSEILQKYQGNTLVFAISRHAVRLPAPNNCDRVFRPRLCPIYPDILGHDSGDIWLGRPPAPSHGSIESPAYTQYW